MTAEFPSSLRPSQDRRQAIIYPLLLTALALAVFHDGTNHQFTNWDDEQYIVNNPLIRGFSLERVWAAFTNFHVSNYNPLHLVSYMVDYEVWGLKAGGFFLTSLILHTVTGIFVFRLALRWLPSPAAAALVAAVFLVHPTRVESVAWLSERKDVLSGFFGVASMLVYARHLDAVGTRRTFLLVASWSIFLLALLAKSQLVALPVVLIAMDLCCRRPVREAILSKLPFLALSVLFSIITIRTHAGESAAGIIFPESILVPLAAIPRYLVHLLWPVGLSPHYEFSAGSFQGPLPVSAGALILLLITVCAYRSYLGERMWLLGIVWFFAFVSPVIGIFRINIYMADRYLYLAIVGPLLALAATLLRARIPRPAVLAGSLMVITVFALLTTVYASTFRNSETLWGHVLERNPKSSIGHSNLGDTLRVSGRIAEAATHFEEDLAEHPYLEGSFLGRAVIYIEQGDNDSASKMYELLLQRRPQSLVARIEYAHFLDWIGEKEKAIRTLLDMDPLRANAVFYRKLFDLYSDLNRPREALAAARRAHAMAPFDPASLSRLRLAEDAAAGSKIER